MSASDSDNDSEPHQSIYASRKRKRLENFLQGKSRAAYRFNESLEKSLSDAADSPQTSSSSTVVSRHGCKRHCFLALEGMKEAFVAISKHPAKVLQNRMASYQHQRNQGCPIKISQVLRVASLHNNKINFNDHYTQLKINGSTRM